MRAAHEVETLGLLDGGLPMTVKDMFDVEGLPAAAGIKALLDRTAEDRHRSSHRCQCNDPQG